MLLKEIMNREVSLARPDMSVQEACALMREGDFGVLPVGEDDRLVGMVTDRDVAVRCCADGRDPQSTTVREVMTDRVRWAFEDSSVENAARLMEENQIRRLPVINADKRLVGIVALGDFAVETSEIRPAAEALAAVSLPN